MKWKDVKQVSIAKSDKICTLKVACNNIYIKTKNANKNLTVKNGNFIKMLHWCKLDIRELEFVWHLCYILKQFAVGSWAL